MCCACLEENKAPGASARVQRVLLHSWHVEPHLASVPFGNDCKLKNPVLAGSYPGPEEAAGDGDQPSHQHKGAPEECPEGKCHAETAAEQHWGPAYIPVLAKASRER